MVASREVLEAAKRYAQHYAIVAVRADKRPWGNLADGKDWRRLWTIAEIEERLKGPRCVAVGFLGGKLNHGIVPLDFDTEAGEAWWRAECKNENIDPDDFPTVITPGKLNGGPRVPGRHRYVTDARGLLGNAEGELKPLGINVRGNGHAMLPPSPHPDGGSYRWLEFRSLEDYSDGIPVCPAFIYDAIAAKQHKAAPKTNGASSSKREEGWCMAAFRNVKEELARQREPGRNNALNNAAMQLGHLEHFGVFDEDMARAALKKACESNGLLSEGLDRFHKTFDSGWKAGMASPGKLPDQAPAETRQQPVEPIASTQPPAISTISGAELDTQEFPPVEWIIESILPTGLALLAGKSKIGKSWLAMDIATAVACGVPVCSNINVNPCDVLYIALEDPPRRLQSRMRLMLAGQAAPANLLFATEWPDTDHGCLERIELELEKNRRLRMVIVDTFGKVRGRPDSRSGVYQQDYKDMGAFHAFATAHNIALILVHHTRKQDATDVMDLISGSTGIVGAADTLMVLQRKRGQEDGTLSITGRDIVEDGEFALRFHKDTAKWEWLGEAKEVQRDTEQRKVLNLLGANAEPMGPTDLATELEISVQTVKTALRRLKKAGAVFSLARGLWSTKPEQ